MDEVVVNDLPAYGSPTTNDIVLVIKNADGSLNTVTLANILALISVPTGYTSNPAALGTASPGSSSEFAKGDHIHPKPTAADLGVIAAPGSPASGQYLQWNGSAWVAASLPVYNGGVS